MVLVIVHLIEGYIIELGTEGRLVQLQLEDMLVGVREDRNDILADYLPDGRPVPRRVRPRRLPISQVRSVDLLSLTYVARVPRVRQRRTRWTHTSARAAPACCA